MRLKIIASALLISAAMGGAAFAQTATANGQAVTDIDLPRVPEYGNQFAANMTPTRPERHAGIADLDGSFRYDHEQHYHSV